MEAYESVALRDQNRKINGTRLTYTTDNQRYVITGAPVTIDDECHRETKGRTLTYDKAADTVVIDGTDRTRTQTKGGGKCQ
jgi:lipopolysaccharide export system protein LptA